MWLIFQLRFCLQQLLLCLWGLPVSFPFCLSSFSDPTISVWNFIISSLLSFVSYCYSLCSLHGFFVFFKHPPYYLSKESLYRESLYSWLMFTESSELPSSFTKFVLYCLHIVTFEVCMFCFMFRGETPLLEEKYGCISKQSVYALVLVY